MVCDLRRHTTAGGWHAARPHSLTGTPAATTATAVQAAGFRCRSVLAILRVSRRRWARFSGLALEARAEQIGGSRLSWVAVCDRPSWGSSARRLLLPGGAAPQRLCHYRAAPATYAATGWIVARAVDGAAVVIGHLPGGLRPGLGQSRAPAVERKPKRKPRLPLTPCHSPQEPDPARPANTSSRPPSIC
jgi:hypothetical protein